MIETLIAHGRYITQSALYLIGDRQRGHYVPASPIRVFGPGEDGRQIVARVTGLALCQISIVEIEITNECAIVKRSGIGSRGIAADQGAFALGSNSLICRRII